MKTSPLNQKHLDLNAKMADFGGWLMPIEYPGAGVLAEHAAVRERVGIFDVSHLGKASVRGEGALDFLNQCLTNDLTKIADGSAQYTLLCTPQGGVVDDLIAYRNSDTDFFLVPNASNTTDVVAVLQKQAPAGITVTNLHNDYAVLAVQGPLAPKVLEALGINTDIDYMAFAHVSIAGADVILCRTGYTGELGYELLPHAKDAVTVWDALVQAIAPLDGLICGLGARDTLRTEMGYPLHGHELSLAISPVTINLDYIFWAINLLFTHFRCLSIILNISVLLYFSSVKSQSLGLIYSTTAIKAVANSLGTTLVSGVIDSCAILSIISSCVISMDPQSDTLNILLLLLLFPP